MKILHEHVQALLIGATGAPPVWTQRAGGRMRVGGVTRGSRGLVVGALSAIAPPLLVIIDSEEEESALEDDLASFGVAGVTCFPSLAEDGVQAEILSERLWLLRTLVEGVAPPTVILATVSALLEPVPPPEEVRSHLLTLRVGQQIDPDELAERLVDAGLARRARAEVPGEFSVRGGLVDIFPYAEEHPLRVELLDRDVESIRRFECESQRSVERLNEVSFSLVAVGRLARADTGGVLLPEFIAAAGQPALEVWVEPRTLHARAGRLALARGARDKEALFTRLAEPRGARVDLTVLAPGATTDDTPTLDLGAITTQRYRGNLETSFKALATAAAEGERIRVFCRNAAEIERFQELLAAAEAPPTVVLSEGLLSEGFCLPTLATTLLSGDALIGRSSALRRRQRRFRGARPLASHLELRPGDTVVHVSHGLARYIGLESVAKEGRRMEHLVLEFADQARLLVNVANTDLVHRYVGAGDGEVTLSKLGSTRWRAKRSQVAEEIMKMAAELLKLQALRATKQGIAHAPTSRWQTEFEAAFPYTETPDQLKGMVCIHEDLGRSQPMDRLLCGDVGYGKTELAMRAAFRAVDGGYQAAVLVPTTVLAAQHLRTFRERMAAFPVRVEMLSRFQTRAQERPIVKDLAEGGVDIVIGTHRLLSADVKFKSLGLVVIDEEQRFGVTHKEHLKRMRMEVDVLTLTATPIPRTLHMAMLGIRDISTLTTPPRERTPVSTEIVEWSDKLVAEAIERELARDGQTFLVHNRVHDIQELARRIMKLVPSARVGIGHGQMAEGVLSRTMTMFVEGRIDVLVCTTIIENGLDIPNANTIIIDHADHFGLAELHQLRGRVGRYNRKAYCYLMVPPDRAQSEIGMKRLKAIEEFAELGAGFDIAMRDLEIRGAGNIVGAEQSGHIAAVGYELYCRLLRAASDSLRHLDAHSMAPEVPVDLGVDGSIPEEYVPDPQERLVLYTQLSAATSASLEEERRAELLDRFGPIPEAAEALLVTARAKAIFSRLGVLSVAATVDATQHRLILKTPPGDAPAIAQALQGSEHFVRYTEHNKVMIDLLPVPENAREVLTVLRELLLARPVAH